MENKIIPSQRVTCILTPLYRGIKYSIHVSSSSIVMTCIVKCVSSGDLQELFSMGGLLPHCHPETLLKRGSSSTRRIDCGAQMLLLLWCACTERRACSACRARCCLLPSCCCCGGGSRALLVDMQLCTEAFPGSSSGGGGGGETSP
jgi:hypothetical protein